MGTLDETHREVWRFPRSARNRQNRRRHTPKIEFGRKTHTNKISQRTSDPFNTKRLDRVNVGKNCKIKRVWIHIYFSNAHAPLPLMI
jgi:hypothetical protein